MEKCAGCGKVIVSGKFLAHKQAWHKGCYKAELDYLKTALANWMNTLDEAAKNTKGAFPV